MSKIVLTKQPEIKEEKRKVNPLYWGSEEDLIEQFSETHKQRKAIVKDVLDWDLATNNDFLLFFECLRMEFPEIETTSGSLNVIFKIPKNLVKHLPSPESYTRARRSLNAVGIGLPTNRSVFIRRMRRQKAIKQFFRDEKEYKR